MKIVRGLGIILCILTLAFVVLFNVNNVVYKTSNKYIDLFGYKLMTIDNKYDYYLVKNVDVNEISAYDEKPRNFLFSRTVRGYNNSPEQNVAEMQFALLKSKAADGDSFVIVGRCSDELFEGLAPYLSIFIHGDEEARIERIMKVRNLDRKKAKQAIERHDRKRRQYHNNFCQKKWGESKSYHLCINSSRIGIDACVDLLADYISKLNK